MSKGSTATVKFNGRLGAGGVCLFLHILTLKDKVIDSFSISLDGMKELASRLTGDFEKGLAKEGDDVTVKMLITYVHALPDGTEKGDFLALDLGGSNFRVLLISKYCGVL